MIRQAGLRNQIEVCGRGGPVVGGRSDERSSLRLSRRGRPSHSLTRICPFRLPDVECCEGHNTSLSSDTMDIGEKDKPP